MAQWLMGDAPACAPHAACAFKRLGSALGFVDECLGLPQVVVDDLSVAASTQVGNPVFASGAAVRPEIGLINT